MEKFFANADPSPQQIMAEAPLQIDLKHFQAVSLEMLWLHSHGSHNSFTTHPAPQVSPTNFVLVLVASGRAVLRQREKQTTLHKKGLTLIDLSAQCNLMLQEKSRVICYKFPGSILELPSRILASVSGQHLSKDPDVTEVTRAFLLSLSHRPEVLHSEMGSRLLLNTFEIITTLLASQFGVHRNELNHRFKRLRQIYAFIEHELSNTDLSPKMIAEAHFTSVRNLHAMFAEQGDSVSSWIRSRRLENARRDITDPLLADETIAAIAARWSFYDATSFSRAFRREFGQTPTAARRESLDPEAFVQPHGENEIPASP